MKRLCLSIALIHLAASSAFALDATLSTKAKNAVDVLVRAEMQTDGRYHVKNFKTGQDKALTFVSLSDDVRQEGNTLIVTGNFKEGDSPVEVVFTVSTTGGDTGAPYQVTSIDVPGATLSETERQKMWSEWKAKEEQRQKGKSWIIVNGQRIEEKS